MSYEYGLGLGLEKTVFEQGWEWLRESYGGKNGRLEQKTNLSMPGATPDGKPSAESFASYAREAAVRETAAVDEERAPLQETGPDSTEGEERSWGERYQTHVTLISTVAGLGTFAAWLLLRKKNSQ